MHILLDEPGEIFAPHLTMVRAIVDEPRHPRTCRKAKAPVEFGAKYDESVDENGHVRLWCV